MMDANVFHRPGEGYMVSLVVADRQVEKAGPFDEEHEAVDMARRSVYGGGTVGMVGAVRTIPYEIPTDEVAA